MNRIVLASKTHGFVSPSLDGGLAWSSSYTALPFVHGFNPREGVQQITAHLKSKCPDLIVAYARSTTNLIEPDHRDIEHLYSLWDIRRSAVVMVGTVYGKPFYKAATFAWSRNEMEGEFGQSKDHSCLLAWAAEHDVQNPLFFIDKELELMAESASTHVFDVTSIPQVPLDSRILSLLEKHADNNELSALAAIDEIKKVVQPEQLTAF